MDFLRLILNEAQYRQQQDNWSCKEDMLLFQFSDISP